MELLSESLSPFDDLEFICQEHGIPCLGLCSDYLCKTKTKLLCMKCIKSGNTCITKEKHELISISEMLFRFFKTETPSKSDEIMKIKRMEQIVNNYDKNELNNMLTQFKNLREEKSIKQIEKNLSDSLNYFIDLFNIKNKKKIEKLKRRSKSSKKIDNDINIFLDIKLPEIDQNNLDNKQKLDDIIKKGYQLSKPKNFVNSIKLLNNINKCSEISNKLNKKIYVNNILSNMSNINDKRTKLENEINSTLEELEKKYDKKMEEIEESIIPKEIPTLYSSYNTSSYLYFFSDPKKLKYERDICNTAHKLNTIDKVFCAFKSFSNESFIVWGTPIYSLEFFDINQNKIIYTIKNAHVSTIYSCRHSVDTKNKTDYIITSSSDRNVKVWELKSFTCKCQLLNSHYSINIFSVCILFEENENKNYIITSSPNDFIKIWDFSGKLLKRFGQSDENHYLVDTFYDNKYKKYYIINGNSNDVKSYYFTDGELYHRYKGIPQSCHMSALVYEYNEQNILIECDGNGFIRMWDFHTSNLIKSIFTNSFINLRGICLWNEKYLFVGASDHQIKLIDLNQGKYIKFYKEHTSKVCTLEKIKHDKYGECLISQGIDGKIKMWSTSE